MRNQINNSNIMIVDDTPANLTVLEEMFSKIGYQVRPIISGKMAISAAKKEPPDLILLDIMMPEMDGFEVCKSLKKDPQLAEIPVIFISALTDTIDKVEAFSAGGVDYVTKPFQFEEISARVQTHLKLQRLKNEIADQNQVLQQTIDDLKSTQSQLVQSEKMASLGVLTAGIAHEINNPVNYVNASTLGLKIKLKPIIALLKYLELNKDTGLLEKFEIDLNPHDIHEAIQELISNITNGTERIVEIIKGLQAFSRKDQGKKVMVNIHDGLNSTLVLLRSQYKDNIIIERNYGSISEVSCYPGRLNQVFMNVIKNAIDAIMVKKELQQQEKIEIQTSMIETPIKQVKIVISDTGIGISEDDAKKVFDPFFTTKEVGKGNGLGMSISLGIIQNHQGSINVQSGQDGGTIVTMTIPEN